MSIHQRQWLSLWFGRIARNQRVARKTRVRFHAGAKSFSLLLNHFQIQESNLSPQLSTPQKTQPQLRLGTRRARRSAADDRSYKGQYSFLSVTLSFPRTGKIRGTGITLGERGVIQVLLNRPKSYPNVPIDSFQVIRSTRQCTNDSHILKTLQTGYDQHKIPGGKVGVVDSAKQKAAGGIVPLSEPRRTMLYMKCL